MTTIPSHLWHYTCDDHGYPALGDAGLLYPAHTLTAASEIHWPGRYVWLTDMAHPDRDALGLTMNFARCDRTRHRYRVTDTSNVRSWLDTVRHCPTIRARRHELENAPGARPAHWWISLHPVPVAYDPR